MAGDLSLCDLPGDLSARYLPYTPTLRQKQRATAFVKASYLKSLTISSVDNEGTLNLFARIYRSQRKSEEPHRTSLDVDTKGKLISDAYCSCKAGLGGRCSHVLAVIFMVEEWKIAGYKDVPSQSSSTSLPQQWDKPRGPKIKPEPVSQIIISRPGNLNRKRRPIMANFQDNRKHKVSKAGIEHLASLKKSPISYLVGMETCTPDDRPDDVHPVGCPLAYHDYFGEAMSDTNSSRLMAFSLSGGLDQVTNKCDWSIHKDDLEVMPRYGFLHWFWQLKFEAAKNVAKVTDTMLRACGGSGYRTDLGLERLIRDGKAGWVMGPSNEVLRQWAGKTVLMGLDVIDYWVQKVDERNLNTELKKLTRDQKSDLAERLAYELKLEDGLKDQTRADRPQNDRFFDDPFNTSPAVTPSGLENGKGALSPDKDSQLTLSSIMPVTEDGKIVKMGFGFPPGVRHLGTLPGQYIQIRMPVNGQTLGRFISPTSVPDNTGGLEIVVRYENQGHLARFLASLKTGHKVSFRGPCGGFEYEPNKLDHVTCICSGIGVTPGLQIVRAIASNKSDKTKVTLLFQAKDREHLLYKSELDGLAFDPRVKVVYSLQDPDGDWTGPTGTMGVAFLREHLGETSRENRKVLVCGGTPMVTSCLEGLYRLRYNSDQIFIYGPFGAELVRAVYGRGAKLTTQVA